VPSIGGLGLFAGVVAAWATLIGSSVDWKDPAKTKITGPEELALSVVLLVAGTLFVRSLMAARAVDVGFDTNDRVLMSVNLGLQGYDEARGQQFYDEVATRLRETQGVSNVSWVFPTLFDSYGRGIAFYVEGLNTGTKNQTLSADLSVADVGFTDALGLRLEAGRSFVRTDSASAPAVMIVSRQLANRLWPGRDPIGQRARAGSASGRELTVIGGCATRSSRRSVKFIKCARISSFGRTTAAGKRSWCIRGVIWRARRAMCAASLPQPIPRSRTSVSRP